MAAECNFPKMNLFNSSATKYYTLVIEASKKKSWSFAVFLTAILQAVSRADAFLYDSQFKRCLMLCTRTSNQSLLKTEGKRNKNNYEGRKKKKGMFLKRGISTLYERKKGKKETKEEERKRGTMQWENTIKRNELK